MCGHDARAIILMHAYCMAGSVLRASYMLSFKHHNKPTLQMRQLRLGWIRMKCKGENWELKPEIF